MPRPHEDVFRLDVTVDEPRVVGVLQCLGQVADDVERLGNGKATFLVEQIPQRPLFEVGHDIEQTVGALPRVDQRKDVGMLQLCRHPNLAGKLTLSHLGHDVRRQGLDGHLPPVLHLPGQVHGPHSTPPQHAVEDVSVGQGRLESSISQLRHDTPYDATAVPDSPHMPTLSMITTYAPMNRRSPGRPAPRGPSRRPITGHSPLDRGCPPRPDGRAPLITSTEQGRFRGRHCPRILKP
jgi:hypothetical protein